jgi:hypothetical protein
MVLLPFVTKLGRKHHTYNKEEQYALPIKYAEYESNDAEYSTDATNKNSEYHAYNRRK